MEPEVLPRRVVLPVLRHPESFVQLQLPLVVLAPGADRRHLHHEGGNHPLLPQLVDGALSLRHTERHEHVRRHPGARIAFLVVDEEIPGHVDVRTGAVVELERADRIDDRVKLPVVLRHRLAVPARILNRGGRTNVSSHRLAPPCSGPDARRPGVRTTIPQPWPFPLPEPQPPPRSGGDDEPGAGSASSANPPDLHRTRPRRDRAVGARRGARSASLSGAPRRRTAGRPRRAYRGAALPPRRSTPAIERPPAAAT